MALGVGLSVVGVGVCPVGVGVAAVAIASEMMANELDRVESSGGVGEPGYCVERAHTLPLRSWCINITCTEAASTAVEPVMFSAHVAEAAAWRCLPDIIEQHRRRPRHT